MLYIEVFIKLFLSFTESMILRVSRYDFSVWIRSDSGFDDVVVGNERDGWATPDGMECDEDVDNMCIVSCQVVMNYKV